MDPFKELFEDTLNDVFYAEKAIPRLVVGDWPIGSISGSKSDRLPTTSAGSRRGQCRLA